MKVKELKEGTIYKCLLSKREVLVIKTDEQTVKNAEDKDVIIPETIAGKIVVELDSGDFKYSCIELHDGQLTKLNS